MTDITPAELEALDFQCIALTKRGKRCKNYTESSQVRTYGHVVDEVLPDGREVIRKVVTFHNGDYQRIQAGLCIVHEGNS